MVISMALATEYMTRTFFENGYGNRDFHAFRHSVASILNACTGNLKLAQRLLGHSTVDMTADVYTHTSVGS